MEFNDELKALVDEVASRVDRWTAQSAWIWEPGSPASAEIANTEVRQDGTRWGDRPVRTAYAYAQMATKLAVEMSRCAALLIGAGRPAPGIEAETRAALEAGSVAWWLLEEKLSARERVCRMQLLRRNSAREHAKSIKEVGEDPALAGKETVAGIEAECRALGLAAFTQKGDELEGQTRLGYTARVKALTDDWATRADTASTPRRRTLNWPGSGGCSGRPARRSRPASRSTARLPNPKASFAAADGGLKSMMGPMERITLLFGWTVPGRGEEISATIDHVNSEMKRLRP